MNLNEITDVPKVNIIFSVSILSFLLSGENVTVYINSLDRRLSCGFRGFSHSLQANFEIVFLKQSMPASIQILSNPTFANDTTIRRYLT